MNVSGRFYLTPTIRNRAAATYQIQSHGWRVDLTDLQRLTQTGIGCARFIVMAGQKGRVEISRARSVGNQLQNLHVDSLIGRLAALDAGPFETGDEHRDENTDQTRQQGT